MNKDIIKKIIGYSLYPYFRCQVLTMPWSDTRRKFTYNFYSEYSYKDLIHTYSDESIKEYVKEISRRFKQQKFRRNQRDTLGFDETCTWSLDYIFAVFIYQRLKMFKEMHDKGEFHTEFPDMTPEQWSETLGKMLSGFNIHYDVEDGEEAMLTLFKEYHTENPEKSTFKRESDEFLFDMVLPVCSNKEEYNKKVKELQDKADEGLSLFAKNMGRLWD